MVLHSTGCGRVGHRRNILSRRPPTWLGAFGVSHERSRNPRPPAGGFVVSGYGCPDIGDDPGWPAVGSHRGVLAVRGTPSGAWSRREAGDGAKRAAVDRGRGGEASIP